MVVNEKFIKVRYFFQERTSLIYSSILLGLCFFIWGVPGKGLLYFGDVQASYIFYPEKVYGSLNIWSDLYNSGATNYGIFQNYIFSFLVIISRFIFNLDLHSYLYSFLGFYLFSLSFFYLYKKIFKDDFIAFLIGVFALLSPITHTYFSGILLIYSLAFINFSLSFLYNIFFSKQKSRIMWKEVILSSIFLTMANIYLQNFFLYLYMIPFFILFYFKHIYRNKYFLFKNYLMVSLLYVLLNIFWIYLLIYQVLNSSGNFFNTAIQSTASMDVANLITKLTNVVNFFRIVPYYFIIGESPLVYYNNKLSLLFSSYIIAIIAFSSVFINKEKKYKKGILFCLLLFVITFPILNGNKAPFEKVFLLFWNYVPLAQTFRTFTKLMFIDLYVFSYFLGVSFMYLFVLTNKRYVKTVSIILIALPIIIYNAPAMRGKFLLQEKIPDYYYEMKDKFFQPINANTMIAPQTNWLVTYKWRTKEKDTDNILPFFYNGRVFTNGASYTMDQEWQNYNNLAASFIINQSFDKLGYLVSFKNVGFMSLQDDIDSFLDFNEGARITTESNIKGGGIFFKEIAKFGDVYIYEIPDKYFNQQIFSPKKIEIIKRDMPNHNLSSYSPFIISELLKNERSKDSVLIFEEQNKNFNFPLKNEKKVIFNYKNSLSLDYASPTDSPKIQAVKNDSSEVSQNNDFEDMFIYDSELSQVNIEFKKASPVKYEIVLHGANASNVPIYFSETYDNGWNIYSSELVLANDQADKYNCVKNTDTCFSRQTSKEEAEQYRENNKISVIGKDFISKEYSKSIQNDNLKESSLLKVIHGSKIKAEHFYANGYSNLFVVNPKDICKTNPSSCKINPDGTFDVRLVIFFTPQNYFYLTLAIPAGCLMGCLVYLVCDFVKRRKMAKISKIS